MILTREREREREREWELPRAPMRVRHESRRTREPARTRCVCPFFSSRLFLSLPLARGVIFCTLQRGYGFKCFFADFSLSFSFTVLCVRPFSAPLSRERRTFCVFAVVPCLRNIVFLNPLKRYNDILFQKVYTVVKVFFEYYWHVFYRVYFIIYDGSRREFSQLMSLWHDN